MRVTDAKEDNVYCFHDDDGWERVRVVECHGSTVS